MKRALLILLIVCISGCARKNHEEGEIHVGYLPNLTHIHGLIGEGTGWFSSRLDRPIKWYRFNAGPSIIEGLFSGHLDMAYVGPGPTIIGYLRSKGEAIRVISGATTGGSALVTHPQANIRAISDLNGKKIATPQIGNTQDLALRHLLAEHHLMLREQGGDVWLLPIRNSDQFVYFFQAQIDAVWTVEPWVSRLELEAGGKVLLDEAILWEGGDYPTTLLVVRSEYLKEHPEIVREWLNAHRDLTRWIKKNPVETKRKLALEIFKHTGINISAKVIDQAFSKLEVVNDPMEEALKIYGRWYYETGLEHNTSMSLEGMVQHVD